MKKRISTLLLPWLSVLLLVGITITSGCDNFMSGSDVVEELDKVISYANATPHTIRVKADDNTGTITSTRDNEVKVTDEFEIAFQVAQGYKFLKWVAVNVDDNSVAMDEFVEIDKPENLETKVTFLQESDLIQIKPLCEVVYNVTGTSVSNIDTVYSRDTAIAVTFNYPPAAENDLSKISVTISGLSDALSYFETPVIKENSIYLFAKSTNLIPVAQDSNRTVTVTIPNSIYYKGTYSDVALDENYTFSYVIDASTTEKSTITYSYNEELGTFKVDGETPGAAPKKYSIGQTINLVYKKSIDYYFNGWKITDTDGKFPEGIAISYPDNEKTYGFDESTGIATANIVILKSQTGITVSPSITAIPTASIQFALTDEASGTLKVNGVNSTGVAASYKKDTVITVTFKHTSDYSFTGWSCSEKDATKILISYPENADKFGYNAETQTSTINVTVKGGATNVVIKPVAPAIPKASIKFVLDDEKSGSLKVDGITSTGAAVIYKKDTVITVTFKKNADYYFKGWTTTDTKNQIVKITYPDHADKFGYDEDSQTSTMNITVLGSSTDLVIKPVAPAIPTGTVTMSSSHGRSNPSNTNSTSYKELINNAISFDADEGYCFTKWVAYNKNNTSQDVSAYIEFSNADASSTSFTIKQGVPQGIDLIITPKYVERGGYISATPDIVTGRTYRDSPIKVMFDHDMSPYSIYYTETELTQLASQGITETYLKSRVDDNGKTWYYGYEYGGNVVFKNIKIEDYTKKTNLLKSFKAPYFSSPKVLVIPAQLARLPVLDSDGSRVIGVDGKVQTTPNTLALESYIQLMVDISENFFYEESEYNKPITMKEGKRWSYLIGDQGDSDEPNIGVKIQYATANISEPVAFNPADKSEYKNFTINDKKLIYEVTLQDDASGISSKYYEKIQKIYDGYTVDTMLQSALVKHEIETKAEGEQTKTLNITTDLDELTDGDGFYKLSFEASDQNGNTASKGEFYFLLDTKPPIIDDEALKTTSGDNKVNLEWKVDSETDFESTTITKYDIDENGGISAEGTNIIINDNDRLAPGSLSYSKVDYGTEGRRYYYKFEFKDLAGNTTTKEKYINTLPGTITNLTGVPSGNKITLSWDYPDRTGEKNLTYSNARIYYTKGIGDENIPSKDNSLEPKNVAKENLATSGSKELELDLGTTYNFLVYSMDDDGNMTPVSEILHKNTQPRGIEQSTVTGTSGDQNITLNWKNPSGNVVKTEIYYGTTENFTEVPSQSEVKSTTAEIEDSINITALRDGDENALGTPLKIGTKYYFHLYNNDNETDNGKGEPAKYVINTLPGQISAVPTPTLGTTGNSIIVNWTEPVTTGDINSTYSKAKIFYTTGTDVPSKTSENFVEVSKGTTSKEITGLALGTTYNFIVYAVDDCNQLSTNAPVVVTKNTKPNALNSEDITKVTGDKQVSLSWISPSGNTDSTDIYWQTSSDYTSFTPDFTAGTGNAVNVPNSSGRNKTITGLKEGTKYYFNLYNKDAETGNEHSNPVQVSRNTLPGPVSSHTATRSGDNIIVSWTAPDTTGGINSTFVGARIYYTNDGSEPSNNSTNYVDAIDGGTTASPILNKTISGLEAGKTYKFRVYTVDDEGNIAVTAPASVSSSTKPAQINQAGITASSSSNTITLTWQRPAGNFAKTKIIYSTKSDFSTSSSIDVLNNAASTTQTKDITSLTAGKTYYFKLISVDAADTESEPTLFHRNTSPMAPVATPWTKPRGANNVAVKPAWTMPSGNKTTIQRIRVYYSQNTISSKNGTGVKSAYSTSATSGSASITPSGSTMQPGYKYYIKLAAIDNEGNEGELSNEIYYDVAPEAISGLRVTTSGTSKTVEWDAPAGNVTISKYKLYYGTTSACSDGNYEVNTTSKTLSLSEGTTYYFRVDSVIGTEPDTITTQGVPQSGGATKPGKANISSLILNGNSVTLKWNNPTGSKNGFKVYYGTSDNIASMSIGASCGNTQTTATISNLAYGTQYFFKVVTYLGTWTNTTDFLNSDSCSIGNAWSEYTAPKACVVSSVTTTTDSATVNWNAPSAGNYTGFKVFYGTTDTIESMTMYNKTYNSSETTATVTGLTAGTRYYFRVVTYINEWDGADSMYSAVSNSVGKYTPLNKATITNVITTASSTPSDSETPACSATLTWTNPTGNYSGLKVFYGTTDVIASMTLFDTYTSSETTATITGLSGGTQYYFRVVAYSDSYVSAVSENASVSDAYAEYTKVNKVTQFTITSISDTSVTATWTYGEGYHGWWDIWRKDLSEESSTWKQETNYYSSSNFTVTSLTLGGLTPGHKYKFLINVARSGWWDDKESSGFISEEITTRPAAVTPTAETSSTVGKIYLSWTKPAGNVSGYKLYYGTDSSTLMDGTPVDILSTATSHTLTSLTAGTNYYFKLVSYYGTWDTTNKYDAVNANYSSSDVSCYVKPNSVSSLTVSTSSTVGTLTVSWTKPDGDISGYKLYYGTSNSSLSLYSSPSATDTSVSVTGLTAGTNYFFKLYSYAGTWSSETANNANGSGVYSNFTKPNYPSITVTPVSTTSLKVSWSKPTGNVSGYKLYYSSTSNSISSMTLSESLSASDTSVTVNGLSVGTYYYFRLVSYAGDWSSYSAANSNISSYSGNYTKPDAVTGITLSTPSSSSNTSMTVSWTNPTTTYAGVKILYGTSSTPTTVWSGTISKGSTSATITGLSASTQYYFKVLTYSGSWSSYSAANVTSSDAVSRYTAPPAPSAPTLYCDDGYGRIKLRMVVPAKTNNIANKCLNIYINGTYKTEVSLSSKTTGEAITSDYFDIPSYKVGTSYTISVKTAHTLNGGETNSPAATYTFLNSGGTLVIEGTSVSYTNMINVYTGSSSTTLSSISNTNGYYPWSKTDFQWSVFNSSYKGTRQISKYSIGAYEVSQKLYETVMGTNANISNNKVTGSYYPVEKVSWWNAILFCNKLSTKLGLTPCYKVYIGNEWKSDWDLNYTGETTSWSYTSSNNGYRLPSAVEWEYAARGGSSSDTTHWTSYYSGAQSTGDGDTFRNRVAWNKSWVSQTQYVYSIPNSSYNNRLGIKNMSGNVWEWVNEPVKETSTGSPVKGSGGTTSSDDNGKMHCVGGSIGNTTRCGVSTKDYWKKTYTGTESGPVGLRLCRSVNVP